MNSVRTRLARMARLNDGPITLGCSIMLGLGLYHVQPGKTPVYNGSGQAGDIAAVGQDFANGFATARQKRIAQSNRG